MGTGVRGTVTIRPATRDDALAIAEIHVASWQYAYRGILPDDYLDALSPEQRLPMWTRLLASTQPGVHIAVADSDEGVLGFYSAGPSDEGHPTNTWKLFSIFMDPTAMGQGLGRRLLADAEQQMRANGAISGVLRVMTANAGTRRFYEHCGWRPEPRSGRMEDAWGQQVETVRYTKSLETR
jgi:GNAT superfamily N-acetyltransferase